MAEFKRPNVVFYVEGRGQTKFKFSDVFSDELAPLKKLSAVMVLNSIDHPYNSMGQRA